MKHILPALVALGFSLQADAQLARIVVQGSGAPQVFDDFAAAVSAAQPNDKLYLSGGTFQYTGGLVIDKTLHLIGAGTHPDSTEVSSVTVLMRTSVLAPLRITTAASGSTFTGIRFSTTDLNTNAELIRYGTSVADDLPTDIVFQRCHFDRNIYLGFNSGTAISSEVTTFNECYFASRLVGESRAAAVTRCIFDPDGSGYYAISGFDGGALLMENCVLLGSIMANCYGAIIRNCISTSMNYYCYDCSNSTFTNNVIAAPIVVSTSPGVTLTNNIVNADAATFFVSETDDLYQYSDDLHMAPGSPGVAYGTDGTDLGIYGTASPYKPGAVPYNPHFHSADIAPATNSSGELPVNIRVAAQTH
ncbi:MAG: hypothetical protein IPG10_18025 [Flavobacteriales bacterium]|nr:hypothetical protein [Flavobacteriales bacterium]MBK6754072.1 hypothetical protein [Flavobacteriales bacterium]MBK7751892.1 hypothetical protein [Flavobacteriales bacterium]MBK9074052.1 hypothetical protein [Flavobacteriales bacterium]